MTKRILALVLCAMLLFSCALAEDSGVEPHHHQTQHLQTHHLDFSSALAEDSEVYVPGALVRSLFGQAFDAGKLITGDLTLTLDMDPAALGIDGENAETMRSVLELLSNLHLRMGAGKTPDGLRVTLGATLDAQEGKTPVSIDGAANISWDGVSLETDLLPGERVTAKWETLLALAGADADTIAVFSALREVDWHAELAQMRESFLASLEATGAVLEPYLQITTDYFNTLPCEVEENVPAEEGYPAVALQMTFVFTSENLAELGGLLLDRLQKDEALLPQLEMAVQNDDAFDSVDELIQTLRDGLAQLSTRNTVYNVMLGSGEPFPFFLLMQIEKENDPQTNYLSFVIEPDDTDTTWDVSLDLYSLDAAGDIDDAFTFAATVEIDPDDPVLESAVKVLMEMYVLADGKAVYSFDYSVNTEGAQTDEGLPAAQMTLSESQVVIDDDNVVRTVASVDYLQGLSSDGGEAMTMAGTFDFYMNDGQLMRMPFIADAHTYPDGNGGVEGLETISYQIEQLGVDNLTIAVAFTSEDYDPADTLALTETALETVSQEDFAALVGRLSNAGMMKFILAIPLLPENLVNLTLNAGQ